MSLRHVLLTVLAEHEASGYDITRQFDDVLGYFWAATHQQVYRELGKLKEEGLVDCEHIAQADKPDKKIYAISATGRDELQRWLRAPTKATRQHEETLVKLLGVGEVGVAPLRAEILRQRDEHRRRLQTYAAIEQAEYTPLPAGMPLKEKMLYLALRRGISIEKARLQWFEEVLQLMESDI